MRLNAVPMPGGIPGTWFFDLIYWQGFQDNGRGGGEGSGRGGGRACARKGLRAQARVQTRVQTRTLSGPPRGEKEPADEKQVKGAFGARLRVRCPRCRHRQKNGDRRMVVRRAQSGHGLEPQRHRAHRGSDLCVLRASVVNLVRGRRWVMESRSESQKGGASHPRFIHVGPRVRGAAGTPRKRLEGAFGASIQAPSPSGSSSG